MAAIEQGVLTETTRSRLLELERQKHALEEGLSVPPPATYPSLHPNLAGLYERKVAALEDALADPEIRSEAGEILRSVIDRIEIAPPEGDGDDPAPDGTGARQPSAVTITLYGELAAVFGLAEEAGAIENKRGFSLSAGACNHRELILPPMQV